MRQRLTLLILLLVAGLARADERPNVLFIAVDDLNDWVGCMGGHPDAQTPNIDRLARRGTLFTNAHCQAPICGPSRVAVFTGLRPSTTGSYGQHSQGPMDAYLAQRPDAEYLPMYLARQGYRTLAVGKIFHGSSQRAFQTDIGRYEGFGPKPRERFHYDPAWFDDRTGGTQTDWGAYPENDADMPDHKIASWVEGELARPGEQPFFMAVGFVRPHVPWYVPRPWLDRFPTDGLSMPAYNADDLDDLPEISRRVNETPMMPTTRWAKESGQWDDIVQAYLACVAFTDHQIGRVLDALEQSEYADNTIVILWSDHGYHVGEKDRFSKQTLWERSSRVPLIIAGPGLPGEQVTDQPTELIDLYPTVLELCGLPANEHNEGHSLLPLLRDPASDWPHVAITTYGRNNHAIQSQRYRMIRYEDGSLELYDHDADPNEWHNVAADPQYADIIERLRGHLPAINAPWAAPSTHSFNDYFREHVERNR